MSKVATGVCWYLVAFAVLVFTIPGTSKGTDSIGIPSAFAIVMVGAMRLSKEGATLGWCFIYGIGSVFLFFFRFITDSSFRVWSLHEAQPDYVLAAKWATLAVALGGLAALVAAPAKTKTQQNT